MQFGQKATQTRAGNATSETAHAIECSNSLLRSESSSQQVVGIGLNDIMVIAMPDAVLDCSARTCAGCKKSSGTAENEKTLLKQKFSLRIIVLGDGLRAWL